VREAKREFVLVLVPRSADGRFGGSLPLRPPWRCWESGGTPDPCPRRVDSRVRFPGGAGEVVTAASPWNNGAGVRSPPRRRSSGCRRRATGLGLAGVVLARGFSPFGELLSSRFLPRAVADGFCGDGKPVEEGDGGSGCVVRVQESC
jgi:hypothetical protein